MLFPKTQNQLYEMAATQPLMGGVHRADQPTTGRYGLVLGETIYDPLIDNPSDIRIDSIKARITGAPHVRVVIPRESMTANLVIDAGAGDTDFRRISEHKQRLALDLAHSIRDASPSSTDWFHVYYLGEDASKEIKHIASPIEVRDVAGLCISGVTMIMSDFHRLRFDRKLTGTVGIKVNHPADLELPANRGILPVGAGVEIDTDKPRKLSQANELLIEQRQAILQNLAESGLSTVEVVYNPNLMHSFDVTGADQGIAASLKTYA